VHPSDEAPAPDRTFASFALDPRILEAVEKLGFDTPTAIQSATMAPMLAGRDVIARARTGSGKTAAFGLPMLHRVAEGGRKVRALVLTPTRELALQVTNAIRDYAKHLPVRVTTVYGGAPYSTQMEALKRGCTVVVGTPGRILDLVDRQALDLAHLDVLVLDEADEMLRMGFVDDVERVLTFTPPERQVALFSATMPAPIARIARTHLREPVEVAVDSGAMAVDHITQQVVVVQHARKVEALARLLASTDREGTLVFARTRQGCAEVAEALIGRGFQADALHGDLSQSQREHVLGRLRAKRLDVLVATDVAARGLDVDHLDHVINLDLPEDVETYVHRIGRTARAGRSGLAVTFVTPAEREKMRRMVRTLDVQVTARAVATDADIARHRQSGLERALAAVTEEERAAARPFLTRYAGRPLDEVVEAAVALLARDRRIPLELPEEVAAEAPAPRKRSNEPAEPEVLFVAMGRRQNLRAGVLVDALGRARGVPESAVGRVAILERKSFIELAPAALQAVLAGGDALEIGGVAVRVAKARPDQVGGR
jgi:ATP-dependent RNA helicase DeaD